MKIAARVGVALLPLLLLAATPSPHPIPWPSPSPRPAAERHTEEAKGTDKNANPADQVTEPSATVENPIPSPKLEGDTDNHGKQANGKKPWYRTTDGLLTLFNGFLALFTLALVIIGTVQAALFRRALRLDQRPWVLPTNVKTRGFHEVGARRDKNVDLIVEIKNTGRTPALQMTMRALWAQSRSGDEPPKSVPIIHTPAKLLGPNQAQDAPLQSVPYEIFDHAWEGKGPFWIYGFIEYRDIFHLWKPYTTKFCFRLYVTGTLGGFFPDGPYNDCT